MRVVPLMVKGWLRGGHRPPVTSRYRGDCCITLMSFRLPGAPIKSRGQKPAYSYRELCRFPKVRDAPQGPSGDPRIPEKTGISETMTGVSDLLTAKNRHTWAQEDRENHGLRQSSVTLIRSFYHRRIGMESDVASTPQAGARPRDRISNCTDT